MLQEQFCNLDGCLSLTEAQLRLQSGGLSATPRLATRLLALQQRGVRLTWSALELLLSENSALLMLPQWLAQPMAEDELRDRLQEVGLTFRLLGGYYEVLSSDEIWLESQETALVPLAAQSLVQAMSGPSHGASGEVWPDSWKIVADAEDSSRILEHLRSAFRQLRQQGGSPAPLLWLALRRRRSDVTREVARLTHEYLDADIGRHLEALFSPQGSTANAALRSLRSPEGIKGWDLPFLVGLLQILWEQAELRSSILDLVEELTPRWLEQPGWVVSWWEECLASCDHLESSLVQRLAQISLHWARAGMALEEVLLRRLQRGMGLGERLLAAWLLSQLSLTAAARQILLQHSLELAFENSLAGQTLIRVQQILSNLGEEAFDRLLEPENYTRLEVELGCWLVTETLKVERFRGRAEATALRHLATGSRRMLRQLSALSWFPQSQLQSEDELRWSLCGFLEQEIAHLEPPDDSWAIGLLVRLEPATLERLFRKAARDAEQESRALPARLQRWAQHCAAADMAPDVWQIEKLLKAGRLFQERPELWQGLALLLRCNQLAPEAQQILQEQLEQSRGVHPHRWPEWWEEIQKSGVVAVRERAERELIEVLRGEQARQTVQAVLFTMVHRVDDWSLTRPLMQVLSQRLLFLARPETPQQRLRWALSSGAEGDGVFVPQSWDAEQRDLALELLGRLALNPRLEDDLKRPARVRCWQFLQDWLDSVQRGGDSYQHRSMPLWSTARRLLPLALEAEVTMIDNLAQSVMTAQATCPDRLRLLTHSDCLGFLLDWSCPQTSDLLLDSSLAERQGQVLQLLQDLLMQSDHDYRPVAVGYLVSIQPEQLQPSVRGEWRRLRQRWEGWLYGE